MLINKIVLFDNAFTRNETKKVCLDNLSPIYVQKYIKKVDGKCIYDITNYGRLGWWKLVNNSN